MLEKHHYPPMPHHQIPFPFSDSLVCVDEKIFCLAAPGGTRYCRHRQGTPRPVEPMHLFHTDKTSAVRLLLAFSKEGLFPVFYTTSTGSRPMTGTFYATCMNKLLTHTLPRVTHLLDDNWSVHRARCVTEVLDNLEVERTGHPPKSPDLNPIEKIFGILTNMVYKGRETKFSGRKELRAAVKKAIEQLNAPREGEDNDKRSKARYFWDLYARNLPYVFNEVLHRKGGPVPNYKEVKIPQIVSPHICPSTDLSDDEVGDNGGTDEE